MKRFISNLIPFLSNFQLIYAVYQCDWSEANPLRGMFFITTHVEQKGWWKHFMIIFALSSWKHFRINFQENQLVLVLINLSGCVVAEDWLNSEIFDYGPNKRFWCYQILLEIFLRPQLQLSYILCRHKCVLDLQILQNARRYERVAFLIWLLNFE